MSSTVPPCPHTPINTRPAPPPPPVWLRLSCVAPLWPWREGLHGVWAVFLCCWTKVFFFSSGALQRSSTTSSSPTSLLHPPPLPMVHLILSVKVSTLVFAAGVYFYLAINTGSDAAIVVVLLLVAAWLRCYTKSLPTSLPHPHLPVSSH